MTLYHSLDEPSRLVLLEIIRQGIVDTIAGFFGILDGCSWLDKRTGDFILTTTEDSQKINGDLLDLFLMDEDSGAGGR